MNVKINITQLRYMLDNIPADQNIMLAGRHGIGKSEILTEYFSKNGMKVTADFQGDAPYGSKYSELSVNNYESSTTSTTV